jgi:UDP-N-acetyl-D-glucosamine dehydrogenase
VTMRRLCIIGLGYVGSAVAKLANTQGYTVYGLEISPQQCENIRVTQPYIKLNHPDSLQSETIIIAVPTPINEKNMPDLEMVKSAAKKVAQNINKTGQLVVLESTINPSVSRKIILPIFESYGHKVGTDFYLAHCPERINPGSDWDIADIPRVIGAITSIGLENSLEFYRNILNASVTPLSSIESAEMVKIYENSFRAVNIAFANEMALVNSEFGLDTLEIINGVKTKPFGLDICQPGPGVGGHCIPVDPFYLIEESKARGFEPKFLKHAMEINNYMPRYVTSILIEGLNEISKCIKGSTIGILGVSYKRDVGDTRESPSLKVIDYINKLGGIVHVFDPFLPELSTNSLKEVMACEAIILMTDHSIFKSLDFSNVPVVIDGRNVLDRSKIQGVYRGIGRN